MTSDEIKRLAASNPRVLTRDDLDLLRERIHPECFVEVGVDEDGKLYWESSGYHVTEVSLRER